jgi:PI31 proteasome regulator
LEAKLTCYILFLLIDKNYCKQKMNRAILDIIKDSCKSPNVFNPMDANALLVHAWIVKNFNTQSKLNDDWSSKGPEYYNFKYTGDDTINAVITQVADHFVAVQLFVGGELRSAHFPIAEAVKGVLTQGHSVDAAYDPQGADSVLDKLSEALLSGSQKSSLQESQGAQSHSNVNIQATSQPEDTQGSRSAHLHPENPDLPRVPHPPAFPDLPRVPQDIPNSGAPAPLETPPGFEDEYEMLHSRRPQLSNIPSPFAPIGSDDLYPPEIGRDPQLSSIISPAGRSHEGMHPGPQHPLFGGRGQGGNNNPDDLSRPPGARWDPTGPFGPGGPGGPRGPGSGGFGSGGFGNSGFGGSNFI